MDERDIHKQKKKTETTVRRIENSEEISQEDAELIKKFNQHLKTVRSVKIDRRHFYLSRVSKIAKWVNKSFKGMEREDVKKIQVRIEEDEDYTEWTKHDNQLALKKYFKWLHKENSKTTHGKARPIPK
ncbi:MAG: XerD/XerC family integrase [Candidatus Methanohalarchaeum thermophilum]|uniref:XerD/XerC family integrase n=1 Tax=Methanohalarchaeum thermophilum TaxID=1903181 RepID=A0A1Q6DVW3_METT1|nr:MAG: XerD/XerC family integrase [Candidatus Methanohalarchaeum thermophilum]